MAKTTKRENGRLEIKGGRMGDGNKEKERKERNNLKIKQEKRTE